AFSVRFRATIGPALAMELEVRNDSHEALIYEEALHTYFAVSDVREISVSGLEGTSYIDKTDGFKLKTQGDRPLRITKETEEVHQTKVATGVTHYPIGNRRIAIEKSGSSTTVAWNPWIEKIRGMADMAPGEWRDMICVETANASENAIQLAPGES